MKARERSQKTGLACREFDYGKRTSDKVYHIHLRYTGDNDELYFRDCLNEHPQVAEEYEALKLELIFFEINDPPQIGNAGVRNDQESQF